MATESVFKYMTYDTSDMFKGHPSDQAILDAWLYHYGKRMLANMGRCTLCGKESGPCSDGRRIH